VFLLNSGEELHYGVCVYSNELVSVCIDINDYRTLARRLIV